ncbi:Na+/H+ antiporter subunit E [Natronoflexus pectinivorans]|uniref:Multicomponent Na+:H+ antiporter subunit E n=1 Tax=Natronoflexus pectinivorans TaxID=682526 RepID=A0A4R2GJJ9_9BACT|nr:Na+/H+ antiporter subunit E [Natronoflexus pectinivorans]TCO08727.1 multicomponent Na+:H+ antiporter subunit E [Natronoflexus pectinivorans]
MKAFYFIYLFLYFGYTIVRSGWLAAWVILKGSRGDNGGIIYYQTQITRPMHLVLFFNLISMTPGALSVDLSPDNKTIHVHLLDMKGENTFLTIAGRIERLLLKSA